MLSKIPSFRDCDFENFTELSGELQQSKFFTYGTLNQKISNDQTSLTQHQNFEDFHFTKSTLLSTRDYQISFEADFMQQHQNAFNKQLENFIESSFKFYGNRTITFLSTDIFGNNLSFGHFSNHQDIAHLFQENLTFLKILQHQEKLNQFLHFIFKTLPKQIAIQLTYLASVAWSNHLSSKQNQQSLQKITQKSKTLAQQQYETLYSDQRLKYINLKIVQLSQLNQQILIKDAFKLFLQFFFTTIILVGQQFFQNPYDQIQFAKRQRTFRFQDDDDNQPSSTNSITFGKPTKKLHFY